MAEEILRNLRRGRKEKKEGEQGRCEGVREGERGGGEWESE